MNYNKKKLNNKIIKIWYIITIFVVYQYLILLLVM